METTERVADESRFVVEGEGALTVSRLEPCECVEKVVVPSLVDNRADSASLLPPLILESTLLKSPPLPPLLLLLLLQFQQAQRRPLFEFINL